MKISSVITIVVTCTLEHLGYFGLRYTKIKLSDVVSLTKDTSKR
uniref:Uncharacterized protein n=1 Tax=viral metagenome TaxID=1070528 RepID=A0A6C0H7X3_9ZZZZ